jgi:hypothetical protein
VAPVALAFLLSTSIELLQAFVPTRVSSAYDISTNVLGAAIGMMLAAALPVRPSPETFLLACWAAHLLFFASPGWPAECVGWVIVASAAMPQRSFLGRGFLAAGCYLVILYRGLSPFRFASAAGAFNWIPFDGFLLANWEKAIPVLVAKMFWYGAAVWVLRRIGLSWMMAGLAAAVFLGAIEVGQRRIPQHVSEITDPLMAVLLAGAFAAIPAAAREEQVRC